MALIERVRTLALIAVALSASGCGFGDQATLRAEIGRIVPADARQQEECDYASGLVENVPSSLRCRFLVHGSVADITATIRRNLRGAGLRGHSRRGAGPSARLMYGRSRRYAVHLAVIGEGHFLFFQLRRSPVPPGQTGVDVTLARTE
jgi:hypothetical protein